jgi:hypothetical protein
VNSSIGLKLAFKRTNIEVIYGKDVEGSSGGAI